MSPALGPEILRTIFQNLNQHSNINNVIVSRAWSEVALDELWRKVDDLPRLFNILVPLNKSKTQFSRRPTASDWASFQRYTKRVRFLDYDEGQHKLSRELAYDIATTRTSLIIFPNIQEFRWGANLPLSVLFMSPTIKVLKISVSEETTADILHRFAEDITSRMPNFTHLCIYATSKNADRPIPMNVIKDGIIQLLTPLRQLQTLKVPRFFFTTRLAELLSDFSRLANIYLEYHGKDGDGDPGDILVFKPELLPGSYSSLVHVCLCATYRDSTRFFGLFPSPSILTYINIESPILETPYVVHRLLNMISKKCPRLKRLTLNSPRWAEKNDTGENHINLKTLEPLFTYENLSVFEIYHHHPLDLTLEDLEKVATGLPFLTRLNLNDEPRYFESPKLTLEALLPFARHCLELKTLGLFINASSNTIPSFRATSPLPIFSELEHLWMGTSRITHATPVAMYLSRILPSRCYIDSGTGFEELFNLDAKGMRLLKGREKLWKEVNSSIRPFIQIREEEREKARAAMLVMEREKEEAIRKVKEELNDSRRAITKKEEE